jgi:hypothetical protein
MSDQPKAPKAPKKKRPVYRVLHADSAEAIEDELNAAHRQGYDLEAAFSSRGMAYVILRRSVKLKFKVASIPMPLRHQRPDGLPPSAGTILHRLMDGAVEAGANASREKMKVYLNGPGRAAFQGVPNNDLRMIVDILFKAGAEHNCNDKDCAMKEIYVDVAEAIAFYVQGNVQ